MDLWCIWLLLELLNDPYHSYPRTTVIDQSGYTKLWHLKGVVLRLFFAEGLHFSYMFSKHHHCRRCNRCPFHLIARLLTFCRRNHLHPRWKLQNRPRYHPLELRLPLDHSLHHHVLLAAFARSLSVIWSECEQQLIVDKWILIQRHQHVCTWYWGPGIWACCHSAHSCNWGQFVTVDCWTFCGSGSKGSCRFGQSFIFRRLRDSTLHSPSIENSCLHPVIASPSSIGKFDKLLMSWGVENSDNFLQFLHQCCPSRLSERGMELLEV